MTAASFAIPINIFAFLYTKESSKLAFNPKRLKFLHWASIFSLIPGIAAFGSAIYRRYGADIPHEKALSSRYYAEI